jgi:quercetin dioxygenase-like cupin family protein
MAEAVLPRVLCDVRELVESAPEPARVSWKLAEAGRQLDANLVQLPPDERIDPHAEANLDVMLLVVAGDGTAGLGIADEPEPLTQGTLLWLPHGSTRSITAGPEGLSYLTVHRRRPGMQIRGTSRPSAGGPAE